MPFCLLYGYSMHKRDNKRIIIIGSAVAVLALILIVGFMILSGDEAKGDNWVEVEVEAIDENPTDEEMVDDDSIATQTKEDMKSTLDEDDKNDVEGNSRDKTNAGSEEKSKADDRGEQSGSEKKGDVVKENISSENMVIEASGDDETDIIIYDESNNKTGDNMGVNNTEQGNIQENARGDVQNNQDDGVIELPLVPAR